MKWLLKLLGLYKHEWLKGPSGLSESLVRECMNIAIADLRELHGVHTKFRWDKDRCWIKRYRGEIRRGRGGRACRWVTLMAMVPGNTAFTAGRSSALRSRRGVHGGRWCMSWGITCCTSKASGATTIANTGRSSIVTPDGTAAGVYGEKGRV